MIIFRLRGFKDIHIRGFQIKLDYWVSNISRLGGFKDIYILGGLKYIWTRGFQIYLDFNDFNRKLNFRFYSRPVQLNVCGPSELPN